MGTKRVPVARATRHKITPAAIAAFERMRKARSEEAYAAAQSDLIDLLALQPWESLLLDNPDEVNPNPAGSVATAHWQKRAEQPEASTLFRQLQEAAAAARAARKQNSAAAPAEAQAVPEGHRRRVRSRRSAAWAAPGR